MFRRILAAAFALALLAPVSALAAPPPNITQTVGVCDPNYPKRCIAVAVDGSIAVTGGGGGGGGASATAASQGTVPVVAGTNKPVAIDLFSSTSVLVKDTTGTPIDWTAPVPVTQSGTWTLQPGNTPNTAPWLVTNFAAVTTAAPTYTTGTDQKLSLTTAGALRTDASGSTQPVSGTVTANLGTIAGVATEASLAKLNIAQGAALGTNTGPLTQCTATSAVVTVTTATINPCTMTLDTGIRVQIMGNTSNGTDGLTNTMAFPLAGANPRLFPTGISILNGSTWDRVRTIQDSSGVPTGLGVQAVAMAPTSAAAQAIAINATTAVASNLVLKSGAGNGYRYAVTTGATAGYLMVFDAIAAPADGAVTPKICRTIAANSSLEVAHTSLPDRFSTGITLVFSLTGCYTKTASATAALEGQVQ